MNLPTWSLRLVSQLTAFAFAIIAPARNAVAHPRLVSASPAANRHLAVAPVEISVTFNENVTLALSKLTLLNATRQPVALDSLRSGSGSGGDSKTFLARTIGKLAAGRYTVKWQAAGSDGHPMRGEFSFVVDASAAASKRPALAPRR